LLFCLFVCFSAVAIDLKDAELFIKSDSLNINQKKQFASFSGNVIVYLEDIQLETTNLVVYYDEINNKKSIVKILIPTSLVATTKTDDEVIMADHGEYDVLENKLTLIGSVKLLKNDNILVTDKMIYFSSLKNYGNNSNAK
jgi:lipopolysaccharide transport protein LptA